jgi:hypothetical protein
LNDFTVSANPCLPHSVFIPVFNFKIDMVDFFRSPAKALVKRLENLDIRQILRNRSGILPEGAGAFRLLEAAA